MIKLKYCRNMANWWSVWTYTFQIKSFDGTEHFGPVQFSGALTTILCMFDYTTLPYTWFVEI